MEFTKEEKNAIEVINEKIEDINNMPINTKNKSTIKFLVEVQKVANELVDIANEIIIKQQKEIEELNKNKQQISYEEIFTPDYIEENFISKDKIRDYKKAIEWKRQQEIKNIGMSMLGSAIDVLEELLEED